MDTDKKMSVVKNVVISTAADELLERGQEVNYKVAQWSMERYFLALAIARQEMANQFSEDEMGMMLEAMTGIISEGELGVLTFVQGVEDALFFDDLADENDEYDEATNLIEKLKALDFIKQAALLDAIERWELRKKYGDHPQVSELLSAPTAYNQSRYFIK